MPLPGYGCHYIDGMGQAPEYVRQEGNRVEVRFGEMKSEKGTFPVGLSYTVALEGDTIRFRAKLVNGSGSPVSEFWFPRIGGWTGFGQDKGALVATPNYGNCSHGAPLFEGFPGGRGPWRGGGGVVDELPGDGDAVVGPVRRGVEHGVVPWLPRHDVPVEHVARVLVPDDERAAGAGVVDAGGGGWRAGGGGVFARALPVHQGRGVAR